MKKIFLKIVIGVVLVCSLFVCFLYTNNEIGVTSSKLEADIRSSQKIKDDWTVDGSVSSTMAAYISYPQDLSDHSFSVYVNRPGLSFGYFFRGGGTLSGIQRGIVEFTVEGYNERAFISMNQQQVQQLEIDDGNTIQVVDIDRNGRSSRTAIWKPMTVRSVWTCVPMPDRGLILSPLSMRGLLSGRWKSVVSRRISET